MARFWALILGIQWRPISCLENEETLLPTFTLISIIRVWGILAVDSGVRCFGLRSCPQQHAGSHLPCLTVASSRRPDYVVFMGISYLGDTWEAKQKVNNKYIYKIRSPRMGSKNMVMICEGSSHCLCFNRFPGPALFSVFPVSVLAMPCCITFRFT